jgi:hypothetical protein
LNHFLDDEETINRLLINTGFEAKDDLEENARESGTRVLDEIDLAYDFSGFDQFVIEPVEQTEQNRHTETEEISVSDFHSIADFDEIPDEEDAIDRLLVNAGFDANDELKQDDGKPGALVIDDISRADGFDVNFEEQYAMVADASIFDSEESELAFDKDATHVYSVKAENPETAKQEQAVSETTYPEQALESLNNHAGITPLSSVRTEQGNIKKQINDYENKIKKAAIITYTSLSFGIVALLSIVVMGVIVSSVQTKVSKLTELVSILEEDMSSIAEKNSGMDINNSDSSIEQLNQKINGLPEQSEEQSQFSSDMLENEMTAIVTKQATINKSMDNQKTKTHGVEKKKSSETTVRLTSAKKKTNNAQPAEDWFVYLTAYKDLGYAKSKAAKFIQKGIPVKVIAVDMNHTIWYRLKVGGFKNKDEATSYAAKIKKSLNLNTVSVGNI